MTLRQFIQVVAEDRYVDFDAEIYVNDLPLSEDNIEITRTKIDIQFEELVEGE